MSVPTVIIYPEGCLIEQALERPEVVVEYMSSVESAVLKGNNGVEIPMSLTQVPPRVTVTLGTQSWTGQLRAHSEQRVELLLADGSLLSTKYDTLTRSSAVKPNSYSVVYQPGDVEGLPKIIFESDSLRWRPLLRCQMSPVVGQTTLALDALIESDRSETYQGQFTVATYQEVLTPTSGQPKPFLHELGTFGLGPHLRMPLFFRKIANCSRVNLIRVSTHEYLFSEDGETQILEGFPELCYIFKTPFGFPGCQLELVDGEYVGRQMLGAHQRDQFVFASTFKSPNLRYRLGLTSSCQNEVQTGPVQTTLSMSFLFEQKSMDSEDVIISYQVPTGMRVVSTSPSHASKIDTWGHLNWKTTASGTGGQSADIVVVLEGGYVPPAPSRRPGKGRSSSKASSSTSS